MLKNVLSEYLTRFDIDLGTEGSENNFQESTLYSLAERFLSAV